MKNFSALHIKPAATSRSVNKLNFKHLTTLEFGQIMPLLSIETIPSDRFKIKANFFSRLAPLVKPTYGDFSFHTMSGFVPYYQLADDYEAWRIGKTTWEGQVPSSRYIRMLDLVYLWQVLGTLITAPSGTSPDGYGHFVDSNGDIQGYYDWTLFNTGGTRIYYKFDSPICKYVMKVMNSLGYVVPSNVSLVNTSDWYKYFKDVKLSAMPLLAYFKMFNDWMSQSQRYNTSSTTRFLRCVKHNITTGGYNATTHCIDDTGITNLFNGLLLCYENDYFTSAWQKPNSPINGIESINNMSVPEGGDAEIFADTDDNFLDLNSEQQSFTQRQENSTFLGQRALDFLRRFDDYVRRRNYSGSRAVQQIYSVFGVKTEDFRSNYAHVLDTKHIPISVGDVTATAQTAGADLGDYSGKAIMGDGLSLNYRAGDFGMLFLFGWFTIKPLNAYGFDKSVLRVDPLEYYNPEFDGMGAEPISTGELFADPLDNSPTNTDEKVFGFTERYNSYRFGRDRITGDFRNYHPDSDMNVWHTGRLLNKVAKVAQSSTINTVAPINSEYNRIFSITDSAIDHFYLTCDFVVDADRPIKSLNEVPRLGVGNLNVSRNGNEIS